MNPIEQVEEQKIQVQQQEKQDYPSLDQFQKQQDSLPLSPLEKQLSQQSQQNNQLLGQPQLTKKSSQGLNEKQQKDYKMKKIKSDEDGEDQAGKKQNKKEEENQNNEVSKVKLGICAMEKKVTSKPMKQILSKMECDEIELIIFSQNMILQSPIQDWPQVHALICFYSDGFPLFKAQEYIQQHPAPKPLLINDLYMQQILWDRTKIYKLLKKEGLLVYRHFFVKRNKNISINQQYKNLEKEQLEKQKLESMQYYSEDGEEYRRYTQIETSQTNKDEINSTKLKKSNSSTQFQNQNKIVKCLTISELKQDVSIQNSQPSLIESNKSEILSDEEETINPQNKIEEYDDYITIDGQKLKKPFVEKPFDAEDHNIYIYYPQSDGGGCKKLFRKVDDKSSSYDKSINNIRVEGNYIYEEFLPTNGFDIKVYCVGNEYAHAEARKAPVLDGKVQRQDSGKEVRYPVTLTPEEKFIAQKIVKIFKQNVIGFDLLRSGSKSYICDVNGWSFVKGNTQYYQDCALILKRMVMKKFCPSKLGEIERQNIERIFSKLKKRNYRPVILDPKQKEELRSVVAIYRHGDRTPKQKMKMKTSHPFFVKFYLENVKDEGQELKVKQVKMMEKLQDVARKVFQDISNEQNENNLDLQFEDDEPQLKVKILQMLSILESHQKFEGINRKVQIKFIGKKTPQNENLTKNENKINDKSENKFGVIMEHEQEQENEDQESPSSNFFISRKYSLSQKDNVSNYSNKEYVYDQQPDSVINEKYSNQSKTSQPIQLLFILKWGGELTHSGQQQAEELGDGFRYFMYPMETLGPGILRLHNTYRHDLKTFTSDEGRCQKTAAHFLKGFLAQEDDVAPIMASLLTRDEKSIRLLDMPGQSKVCHKFEKKIKDNLSILMNSNKNLEEHYIELFGNQNLSQQQLQIMREIGNPRDKLFQLYEYLKDFTRNIFDCQNLSSETYYINPFDLPSQVTDILWNYQVNFEKSRNKTKKLDRRFSSEFNSVEELESPQKKPASSENSKRKEQKKMKIQNSSFDVPIQQKSKDSSNNQENQDQEYQEDQEEYSLKQQNQQISIQKFQTPQGTSPNNQNINQNQKQQQLDFPQTQQQEQQEVYTIKLEQLKEKPESLPQKQIKKDKSNNNICGCNEQGYQQKSFQPCGVEGPALIFKRWRKIRVDFYNEVSQQFNISKISDIYDNIKYDVLHNLEWISKINKFIEKFYNLSELLASFVVPAESGLDKKQKIQNSFLTVEPLCEAIRKDLMWWKYCDQRDFDFWRWKDYGIKPEENMTYYWRHVRSRLYFTSSSHMYALFNMLFYLGQEQQIFENKQQLEELCNIKTIQYLSHFVFKLYEDLSAKSDDQKRFRLELRFSPGNQMTEINQIENHSVRIAQMIPINNYLSIEQVERIFSFDNLMETYELNQFLEPTLPKKDKFSPELKNNLTRKMSTDDFENVQPNQSI